jgi:uncharacterized protein with ParB-like and HNH nuclease domain
VSNMSNVFTVEQLFAGWLFGVPDYQRGYAWETHHGTELLDDRWSTEGALHGNFVLYQVDPRNRILDAEGKSCGLVDVVDGQQRLNDHSQAILPVSHSRQRPHLLDDGMLPLID